MCSPSPTSPPPPMLAGSLPAGNGDSVGWQHAGFLTADRAGWGWAEQPEFLRPGRQWERGVTQKAASKHRFS